MFYATALDLGSVLTALEAAKPLQYAATGLFKSSTPQVYLSHVDIPNFGQAVHPTAAVNPCYLLALRGTEVHIREVPQKSGGTLFAIDQLRNEDTVALRPGGNFGNAVILYGTIGTVSRTAASRELYNFVARAIRKDFHRHQEFLVGQDALEAWRAGVRLTIGASSPEAFDLKRT